MGTLSFKTPYSRKLHKQIVIDRGGGVSLDSQSKQLYMKSKPPGWILSHTLSQRFNRHLKRHFCHCVTSLLCWQCKRTFAVFWFLIFFFSEVDRWAARRTTAGCLPSQSDSRSQQSFISICQRNLLKMKNEIGGFCICARSVQRVGEQPYRNRVGEENRAFRKAAGRATSSLGLLHGNFSL